MRSKWHVLLGTIFTATIWATSPLTPLIYLSLIFSVSFLIYFDHYVVAVLETKKLGVKNAFSHYKEKKQKVEENIEQGIRKREEFRFFHTVEFHILIGFLSFIWIGFFYIFISLIFHTFLDILSMMQKRTFYKREFFFFNWIRRRT